MSANDPKQTLALPMRLPPWQPVLVQLSLAFESLFRRLLDVVADDYIRDRGGNYLSGG